MKYPILKRAWHFVSCMAALGITLGVGVVALEMERRGIKREGVEE